MYIYPRKQANVDAVLKVGAILKVVFRTLCCCVVARLALATDCCCCWLIRSVRQQLIDDRILIFGDVLQNMISCSPGINYDDTEYYYWGSSRQYIACAAAIEDIAVS